jgi:hypothetical protein
MALNVAHNVPGIVDFVKDNWGHYLPGWANDTVLPRVRQAGGLFRRISPLTPAMDYVRESNNKFSGTTLMQIAANRDAFNNNMLPQATGSWINSYVPTETGSKWINDAFEIADAQWGDAAGEQLAKYLPRTIDYGTRAADWAAMRFGDELAKEKIPEKYQWAWRTYKSLSPEERLTLLRRTPGLVSIRTGRTLDPIVNAALAAYESSEQLKVKNPTDIFGVPRQDRSSNR